MDAILEFITGQLNTVAWIYCLLPCVFIGGIFFTIRTGAVQFRRFGYAMSHTVGKLFSKKEAGHGAVTPMQALTTALAGTVGTGNIVGTSQAISMGGYGAVFWLWMAALLGMVIKYSEVTLSIRYRERDEKGDWVGGPMYYITKGLGKNWKFLAVLFAVFAALASLGTGNMSQANAIVGSFNDAIVAFVPAMAENRGTINLVVGICLAIMTAAVLFGGVKRIGAVTEKLIPAMCILYLIFAFSVIFGNVAHVGDAFSKIFTAAFHPEAVMGAGSGIMMRNVIVWGLRRSAFSNEAGLGTAAIAHAAAHTESPVDQGLFGIFEVFMDTIVICTITALAIIVSGVDIAWGTKPGSEMITAAFSTVWGEKVAAVFVAVALMLFAYSTILGWSLYGTRCIQYLFGLKFANVYRIIFIFVIVLGSVASVDIVWDVADTFNGLMSIPNFVALFGLSGVVAKLTKEYFADKKGNKIEK